MATRRNRPVLEALESRELLMGASMSPPPEPAVFYLGGVAVGSSVLSPSPGGETIAVNASGQITSLGQTRVTGTIRVTGYKVTGALKLNSAKATLTLAATGTIFAPLDDSISGTNALSNSSIPYERVSGFGTVQLGFSPGGASGPGVSLTFRS